VPIPRIGGLLKEVQRRLISVGFADIITRQGIGLKQILNRTEPNLSHDRQPTRVGVPWATSGPPAASAMPACAVMAIVGALMTMPAGVRMI
jgi:hypothetical protein